MLFMMRREQAHKTGKCQASHKLVAWPDKGHGENRHRLLASWLQAFRKIDAACMPRGTLSLQAAK